MINYSDLWSKSIYDPVNSSLSNDYQERSGTLLDFAYIRFPGTIPTGINSGSTLDLPLFSSDYETIVYTNNIPVTSEGFDLRTNHNRIIHCFYHFNIGNGKSNLMQLGFRLIFNTTINTINPPSFYYNVVGDTNVYTNTSGFFTVPNWQYIIKGIGIQNKMSQNTIYINNLTFLVMRFNYDNSLIDNNQTYFKENENTFYQDHSNTLNTSRGHVIDTALPTPKLKCYTARSKISGTKESWKTRGYFQHGITDLADEASANMPNNMQMFQGATMSMVTCWCSNDSLAGGPVTVSTDRGNYVIPQGLGDNYKVFYMPPLYNDFGSNYSFLPIILRPGYTQKLNVFSAFDTEGTFLKIESFSFINNTRINNNGGYYSVVDTAVLKNLYSLDPETNCGFTTTPCKNNQNKETNVFQMQVSTSLMYLEFVENTETPQEYFQIQTSYLGSKTARPTTTPMYDWISGKFIHYNNNPIVVFIEYTISSYSVDSYIDTSIQLTFEPKGDNADYTTVTPSFDPARTINLDIVRYIDFGYTAETLNFNRNCINIMHKIDFLEANQHYYMFIRAIDNINHSRIIFNLTKLFFVEIEK